MRIGAIVVFLAGDDHVHNSSTREHPAIVTRVWGSGEEFPTVNLKVFPDCGDPFDATSVQYWKTRGFPVDGKFTYCYREA